MGLENFFGILVAVNNSHICNGFTDQEAITCIFGDSTVHRHPDTNVPIACLDFRPIVLKDGSLCSKVARSPNCSYILTGRGNFCTSCITTRNTLGKSRSRQAAAGAVTTDTSRLLDITNFSTSGEKCLSMPVSYHDNQKHSTFTTAQSMAKLRNVQRYTRNLKKKYKRLAARVEFDVNDEVVNDELTDIFNHGNELLERSEAANHEFLQAFFKEQKRRLNMKGDGRGLKWNAIVLKVAKQFWFYINLYFVNLTPILIGRT
jgi:hypothetical protein